MQKLLKYGFSTDIRKASNIFYFHIKILTTKKTREEKQRGH